MGSLGDRLDVLKEGRGDIKNDSEVFTFIWVEMGQRHKSGPVWPWVPKFSEAKRLPVASQVLSLLR